MSLNIMPAGEFLDELPETMPWIIEPLCLPGSSVMLYGRQKVGKSSAIVQLIHSLTTGVPWLGFPVRQTGQVLYLQIDMAKLELGRALRRAEASGMNVRSGLYIPRLEQTEHRMNFNILNDADQAALARTCEELKPIAVIVDTINDAYTPERTDGDINMLIRNVHRRFMEAIGDAALIFLNHKRKQSQQWKQVDDEDGYLGGSAWAGVVATNLELMRDKETRDISLVLHDLRLDAYPATRIPLKKDENGFFLPQLSSQQMLMLWPDFIPEDELDALRPHIKSRNDVYRDIARRSGEQFETVKKQALRAKGVHFKWHDLIADQSEQRDIVGTKPLLLI